MYNNDYFPTVRYGTDAVEEYNACPYRSPLGSDVRRTFNRRVVDSYIKLFSFFAVTRNPRFGLFSLFGIERKYIKICLI